MITLETFKKTLGEKGKHLTEQEVIKLRDVYYGFAHIFFDMFALKGTQKIVSSTTIVAHKENGNACCSVTFGILYTYSYDYQ